MMSPLLNPPIVEAVPNPTSSFVRFSTPCASVSFDDPRRQICLLILFPLSFRKIFSESHLSLTLYLLTSPQKYSNIKVPIVAQVRAETSPAKPRFSNSQPLQHRNSQGVIPPTICLDVNHPFHGFPARLHSIPGGATMFLRRALQICKDRKNRRHKILFIVALVEIQCRKRVFILPHTHVFPRRLGLFRCEFTCAPFNFGRYLFFRQSSIIVIWVASLRRFRTPYRKHTPPPPEIQPSP